MIRIPDDKIREKYGLTYKMELTYIINIRNKYNIKLPREELNKRYNIKQYNKI